MKKLLLFLALSVGLSAAPDDLILSQAKNPGPGNIQRNVAPVANSALGFDASLVPVVLTAFTQNSATGAVEITASGSNQNITLTPSGSGYAQIGQGDSNGISSDFDVLVSEKDTSSHSFGLVTYANSGFLRIWRAGGTYASPSALSADDQIGGIAVAGRDNSGWAGAAGLCSFNAEGNWTTTSRGTKLIIQTTLNGTTTRTNSLVITGGATAQLTGGAGNMTITAGTGASRTLTLQGTTSGSAAQTFLTGSDTGASMPSTATAGLQLYNTADQTTNYERLRLWWSSGSAFIGTQTGGTGTANTLNIIAQSTSGFSNALSINGNSSSAGTKFGFSHSGGQQSQTSGTVNYLAITPTYNQASGTAANTDLLINRTQTAVGSGAQRLIDAQVGGVSMFNVSNTGVVILGTTLAFTNAGGSGFGSLATVADGTIRLLDAAGTSFNRLQFGGTTSSFPALKRSTTTLQVRLADDSADAGITMAGATLSGALITTPQALSGAGAANVTTSATFLTTTGVADAITLANGTAEGQIKTIVHKVDGGSAILTPTTPLGFATVTFTNVGETLTLQWTSAGWVILSVRGAVVA